jgi:hypothetical protein
MQSYNLILKTSSCQYCFLLALEIISLGRGIVLISAVTYFPARETKSAKLELHRTRMLTLREQTGFSGLAMRLNWEQAASRALPLTRSIKWLTRPMTKYVSRL